MLVIILKGDHTMVITAMFCYTMKVLLYVEYQFLWLLWFIKTMKYIIPTEIQNFHIIIFCQE